MRCLKSCLIGVLTILLAFQVAAQDHESEQPTPTLIRKNKFEILPCVVREGGLVVERNECREGWFTFDRPSLNTMNTIAQSERDCRMGEAKLLNEPKGWDPLSVVLVAGGVVIVVGGVAFLVGYLVASK